MKTDLAHLVSTPGLLAATVLLDQIRAVVKILGRDGGTDPFPGLTGNQASPVHELTHQLWARVDAPFNQSCVDTSTHL